MAPQDLLLEVFCLVDDQLQALNLGRLRQREFGSTLPPRLAEVIDLALVEKPRIGFRTAAALKPFVQRVSTAPRPSFRSHFP